MNELLKTLSGIRRQCISCGKTFHTNKGQRRCKPNCIDDILNNPLKPETTYHQVHQYLQKQRGSANKYQCQSCDKQACDWAYNRNDPDELTADNPYGGILTYSLRLVNYIPLCKTCHNRLDHG